MGGGERHKNKGGERETKEKRKNRRDILIMYYINVCNLFMDSFCIYSVFLFIFDIVETNYRTRDVHMTRKLRIKMARPDPNVLSSKI